MASGHPNTGSIGRDLWPILTLVLLAVVIPTACLIWFLSAAVRNERVATRQRLADVYRAQLEGVQPDIRDFWKTRAHLLSDTEESPAQFLALVRSGLADSYLLFDAGGRLVYPDAGTPAPAPAIADAQAWQLAQQLEHRDRDPAATGGAYAELAATTEDRHLAGRAVRAHARCLARLARSEDALALIAAASTNANYADARDEHGLGLVVPDLELFGLRLMEHAAPTDRAPLKNRLVARVRDYAPPAMPSAQRLFLMRELLAIDPTLALPTQAAEMLAGEHLLARTAVPDSGRLSGSAQGRLWELASADRRVVGLFRRERVVARMQALVDARLAVPGAHVRFQPRGTADQEPAFLCLPAGPALPDWELALYHEGGDPFADASRRQVAAYLWTAALAITAIAVVVLLVTRLLLRQVRLARLKNDFVATVSHELKTPLSAIRVLVDTLRDGRYRDPQQATDYLELIAKENERLSRLIDNFLSFSRMERSKQALDFRITPPAELARAAADAVRHTAEANGFTLDVDIATDLPAVRVDPDAMVTVLLNLLDNAIKYSETDKRLQLRAWRDGTHTCFAVTDHGVGIAPRDVQRVMKRFYQVDRSLARRAGGCGLGLSIVRFIVEAHGGTVAIDSVLGKGSTFTVRIPARQPEDNT